MIKEIEICNFKSIADLKFEPGRVTVLIGANGSGKSNILEAISFGAAAANDKLDNEFLASRGIRVSADPRFMRSAFDEQNVDAPIQINFRDEFDIRYSYSIQKANTEPYSAWRAEPKYILPDPPPVLPKDVVPFYQVQCAHLNARPGGGPDPLMYYLLYSPESNALRKFTEEGQIVPLGIRGEGLFKMISIMEPMRLNEVKQRLNLLDWFEGFEVSDYSVFSERSLYIKDRYLYSHMAFFDQKSANEGFLFLLFYFCLFINVWTPQFFAVDNIEASLNPKRRISTL